MNKFSVTIGYKFISLLIIFSVISCSSTKVYENLSYTQEGNKIIISKKNQSIKWPKKVYLSQEFVNENFRFDLLEDGDEQDPYNSNLRINYDGWGSDWSYVEPIENINNFYVELVDNPRGEYQERFWYYFSNPNLDSRNKTYVTCMDEFSSRFESTYRGKPFFKSERYKQLLINPTLKVKEEGYIKKTTNPDPNFIKEPYIKSYSVYRVIYDYPSFKSQNRELKIKVSFIDETSELPIKSPINISYKLKKVAILNEHQKNYSVYSSEKCSKIDSKLKYKLDEIQRLNLNEFKRREKSFSSSTKINTGIFHFDNEFISSYQFELVAKTPNREPVSFEISGKYGNEKYVVKWPTVPVNVNITKDVHKPKIIKVN